MAKQPKRMFSRFRGECARCGTKIATGDPILWLSRGVVMCEPCADENDKIESGTIDDSAANVSDWGGALAWQSAPKPGESIGLSTEPNDRGEYVVTAGTMKGGEHTPMIDTRPIDSNTVQNAKRDNAESDDDNAESDTDNATVIPKPSNVVELTRHENTAPAVFGQVATVAELLIVIVNGIDRFDASELDALRKYADHAAEHSTNGNHRRLWQGIAKAF